MEGIERGKREGKGKEEAKHSGVSLMLSGIKISPSVICFMYHCVHSIPGYEDEHNNNVQIKQLVGHVILKLNDDQYRRLDLHWVMVRLRDHYSGLMEGIQYNAEMDKDKWLKEIELSRKTLSEMCYKDKKFGEQCLEEYNQARKQADGIYQTHQAIQKTAFIAAEQDGKLTAEQAASLARPNKRPRILAPKGYPSFGAFMGESSSRDQGGQGPSGSR